MSAEDNALKTTFRELGLSKQRRKTEKIEISMYKGMIKYNIDSTPGYFLNWHFPPFMLTLRKLLSRKRAN